MASPLLRALSPLSPASKHKHIQAGTAYTCLIHAHICSHRSTAVFTLISSQSHSIHIPHVAHTHTCSQPLSHTCLSTSHVLHTSSLRSTHASMRHSHPVYMFIPAMLLTHIHTNTHMCPQNVHVLCTCSHFHSHTCLSSHHSHISYSHVFKLLSTHNSYF